MIDFTTKSFSIAQTIHIYSKIMVAKMCLMIHIKQIDRFLFTLSVYVDLAVSNVNMIFEAKTYIEKLNIQR